MRTLTTFLGSRLAAMRCVLTALVFSVASFVMLPETFAADGTITDVVYDGDDSSGKLYFNIEGGSSASSITVGVVIHNPEGANTTTRSYSYPTGPLTLTHTSGDQFYVDLSGASDGPARQYLYNSSAGGTKLDFTVTLNGGIAEATTVTNTLGTVGTVNPPRWRPA